MAAAQVPFTQTQFTCAIESAALVSFWLHPEAGLIPVELYLLEELFEGEL